MYCVNAFADPVISYPKEVTVLEGLTTYRKVVFDNPGVLDPKVCLTEHNHLPVKKGLSINVDGIRYEVTAIECGLSYEDAELGWDGIKNRKSVDITITAMESTVNGTISIDVFGPPNPPIYFQEPAEAQGKVRLVAKVQSWWTDVPK